MDRSPHPPQRDQQRAGRAPGLSGCGGSRFFSAREGGVTSFFGFGATPFLHHVSFLSWAPSPLVPLFIAPHMLCIAHGGRPSWRPSDVGPEGHPPFLACVFRACTRPGTGPDLRPSRHALQHTMPESGSAPGPPAGPGSFFSHRISVFPSQGVPHPGIIDNARLPPPCLSCCPAHSGGAARPQPANCY